MTEENKNNMENRVNNRVNMIHATITFSDANAALTAGIPAWATALAAVKAKMVLINSYNQIGEGSTKGVTTDTKVLRRTMTDLALKCASGTLGYANSINNNTLKALVNFNETKLKEKSKEDADDVCQAIHDATAANIAGVMNYGVAATDVTDLQGAIDLYRTGTQKPRQAVISRSQAKKQVKAMVREVIDNLLKGQMDLMVATLKGSNRPYWDGYRQAREIIDLGTTKAKARGTVMNEDDVPLANVVFTILETGTEKMVKQVVTNLKGKFNTGKLASGSFDLRWELTGYKTVNERNVRIAAGKELQRKVVMERIDD